MNPWLRWSVTSNSQQSNFFSPVLFYLKHLSALWRPWLNADVQCSLNQFIKNVKNGLLGYVGFEAQRYGKWEAWDEFRTLLEALKTGLKRLSDADMKG